MPPSSARATRRPLLVGEVSEYHPMGFVALQKAAKTGTHEGTIVNRKQWDVTSMGWFQLPPFQPKRRREHAKQDEAATMVGIETKAADLVRTQARPKPDAASALFCLGEAAPPARAKWQKRPSAKENCQLFCSREQ